MKPTTSHRQPDAHHSDRRAHPRLPVQRPARLVREAPTGGGSGGWGGWGGGIAGGLAFARTSDVSASGVLIEIATTRPFNVGDAVRVAVLADAAVIDPRSMNDGTVVRAEPAGPGRQRVAVRFSQTCALPLVA